MLLIGHIDDFVKSVVIGVYAIIGIVIGVIVLIAVVITIIVCCVCNKRRATGGTVYRGQQPATVAVPGTYPAQAAPATYPYPQPGAYPQAGYQPGLAQAGYQPPPQGYPAAPGMENKPATGKLSKTCLKRPLKNRQKEPLSK